MKNLLIAAALFASTFVTLAPAKAGIVCYTAYGRMYCQNN